MPVPALEFYGISDYREPLQTELMEYSAIEYLKWCFTKFGGFADSKLNNSNGTDKLFAETPTLYRGNRSQWVYETNLSGSFYPVDISGVYVDNVIQTSGYSIDYNAGNVTFTVAPSEGSIVRVEHSYRTPQIHKIDQWFKQVQFNTNPLSPDFTADGSGIYAVLKKNRIQLPAIVVHVPTKVGEYREARGLGVLTHEHVQPTIFYIMTTNFVDNNRIHDILLNQKPTAFQGLDKKSIIEDNKFPLNYNGTKNTSGLMYPDLCNEYKWKRIDVRNNRSNTITSLPNFHLTTVTWNTELLVN